MTVDTPLKLYGDEHTGLHLAAYHAQVDVVKLLVRTGASLNASDKTWGTPPVAWALTGWHHEAADPRERYYEVVATLVAAGATVTPDWFKDEDVRADPRMLAALSGRA
jgi:ankyrin repeat protein